MNHISNAILSHVDAIKCFPKLPVHNRIYTKKYMKNAKAKSAAKKMKASGESDMLSKINTITAEQTESNE